MTYITSIETIQAIQVANLNHAKLVAKAWLF